MITLLVLLFMVSHIVCFNPPNCTWVCTPEKPCLAVCNPVCKAPRCDWRCEGDVDPTGCPPKPSCITACKNVTSSMPDSCPECEIKCPDQTCVNNDGVTCVPVCQFPQCNWNCVAPSDCRWSSCKFECEAAPCACQGSECSTSIMEREMPIVLITFVLYTLLVYT